MPLGEGKYGLIIAVGLRESSMETPVRVALKQLISEPHRQYSDSIRNYSELQAMSQVGKHLNVLELILYHRTAIDRENGTLTNCRYIDHVLECS